MADLRVDEFVLWFALVFACASSLLIWGLTRRECALLQRKHIHQCRICGYDLRASPECCPECGTPTVLADTYDPVWSGRLDPTKLSQDWPGNPIQMRLPAGDATPAALHRTFSIWAADLLCKQLRARGIAAAVHGSRMSQITIFFVTVPEGDLQFA